jgi:tetratricopeptide (TPR) repeat protein
VTDGWAQRPGESGARLLARCAERRLDGLDDPAQMVGLRGRLKLGMISRTARQRSSEATPEIGRYPLLVSVNDRGGWTKDRLAARYAKRAQRLVQANRLNEAIDSCDRAIQLERDFGWAHAVRGEALVRSCRYEEAITDTERALDLEPSLIVVLVLQSEALIGVRRNEEALAAAEKATRANPKFGWAHVARGRALLRISRLNEGRLNDAIAAFDHAIKLLPDWEWPYALRAEALFRAGRYDEGVSATNKMLSVIRDGNAVKSYDVLDRDDTNIYNPRHMHNISEAAMAFAAEQGLSIEDLCEAIDNFKAVKDQLIVRERAAHVAHPRWYDHKGEMSLPDFVGWAYAAERQAGTLTQATLRGDKQLYTDYYNWRRRPDLSPEVYWLRDLPTKTRRADQALAEVGINPTEVRIDDFTAAEQEVIRRYEAARRRTARTRRRERNTQNRFRT